MMALRHVYGLKHASVHTYAEELGGAGTFHIAQISCEHTPFNQKQLPLRAGVQQKSSPRAIK